MEFSQEPVIFESSPVISVDGSTVFVGNNDKNLYALHAHSGHVKWKHETGDLVWHCPDLGLCTCKI